MEAAINDEQLWEWLEVSDSGGASGSESLCTVVVSESLVACAPVLPSSTSSYGFHGGGLATCAHQSARAEKREGAGNAMHNAGH